MTFMAKSLPSVFNQNGNHFPVHSLMPGSVQSVRLPLPHQVLPIAPRKVLARSQGRGEHFDYFHTKRLGKREAETKLAFNSANLRTERNEGQSCSCQSISTDRPKCEDAAARPFCSQGDRSRTRSTRSTPPSAAGRGDPSGSRSADSLFKRRTQL